MQSTEERLPSSDDQLNEFCRLIEAAVHDLAQPLSAISNYAAACRVWSERSESSNSNSQISLYSSRIGSEVMRASELMSLIQTIAHRGARG